MTLREFAKGYDGNIMIMCFFLHRLLKQISRQAISRWLWKHQWQTKNRTQINNQIFRRSFLPVL